jgi:Inverse autotransporter, beta-domain
MLWCQPARLARIALASIALAGTCAPCRAFGTEADLVQWLTDTAAPALRAAAPANDAALAGREALNRGVPAAFAQLQRAGPTWLQSLRADVSFDPLFQPSYALSATRPLLRTVDRDAIDLRGGVVHDVAGRTAGELGVRYVGRVQGQDVSLGMQGGVENHRFQDLERYTVGAELGLSPLELRASMFDEIPQNPASRQMAERRLDGYDLAIAARIPYLPWAALEAQRFQRIEADGAPGITRNRLSLHLASLEIETGTQTEAELRSWFAQLRWRIALGS